MPSFADIKSQALKAKDSATDKYNSTKNRYQVSSPFPSPNLKFARPHDDLTSDTRRRAIPRGISTCPTRGRISLRRPRRPNGQRIPHRVLQDHSLTQMALLPRLDEACVLVYLPIHPHPSVYRLYLLHLPNLRPRDFLHHRGDSTPLQSQFQTLNRAQIRSIGRISRTRTNKCSSVG